MNEVRLRPQAGQSWLHRKGKTYTVLGITSEPDDEDVHRFPVMVFYQGPDGRRWARTLYEWLQSFVPLPFPPAIVWDGKGLPPVGCDVMFNTASSGDVVGTVTGYGVRGNHGEDKHVYRVDINLVYKGTDARNQRALHEVFPTVPAPQKDFDSME
jgi:hypothetical protein